MLPHVRYPKERIRSQPQAATKVSAAVKYRFRGWRHPPGAGWAPILPIHIHGTRLKLVVQAVVQRRLLDPIPTPSSLGANAWL